MCVCICGRPPLSPASSSPSLFSLGPRFACWLGLLGVEPSLCVAGGVVWEWVALVAIDRPLLQRGPRSGWLGVESAESAVAGEIRRGVARRSVGPSRRSAGEGEPESESLRVSHSLPAHSESVCTSFLPHNLIIGGGGGLAGETRSRRAQLAAHPGHWRD